MRSAWIKWARAIEHQRVLASHMRVFHTTETYEYTRTDNATDSDDPILRVHWKLRINKDYPENWSVLIGDVLTNLRAALDHAFWAAAVAHTGPPARPTSLEFPIIGNAATFTRTTKTLAPLVPTDVWTMIESCQPYHVGADKHTVPLEILRWLSNVDKHRFIHVVGRTAFDIGPVLVDSPEPMNILDQWRNEGPVADGDVVARIKLQRPVNTGRLGITLTPTFAHTPTIQTSDNPVEYRTLASAMQTLQDTVLRILCATSAHMSWDIPDGDTLDLGEQHEAIAADYGGTLATHHAADGTTHRLLLPAAQTE